MDYFSFLSIIYNFLNQFTFKLGDNAPKTQRTTWREKESKDLKKKKIRKQKPNPKE